MIYWGGVGLGLVGEGWGREGEGSVVRGLMEFGVGEGGMLRDEKMGVFGFLLMVKENL